jgi:2-polyprenyl-3-methyl-5-hydroxy-6-metoxy-1,4-benzoquinol methylase
MKMDFYKDIDGKFYDRQLKSKNLFRRNFHAKRYEIIKALVTKQYREDSKILDIGSASCNWNERHLPVFGIDLNENLLEQGKREGRLSGYWCGDVHSANIEKGSIDLIVAAEVLEHIPDVEGFLRRIYDFLSKEGTLIISVPCESPFSLWRFLFGIQVFIQGFIKKSAYYRKRCGHVHFFTPRSLKKLLTEAGYVIDEYFCYWGLTIFAVASKRPPSL